MKKVAVELGDRSYTISIEPGIVENGNVSSDQVANRHCVIVSDSRVAPLYADSVEKLLAGLGAGRISRIIFPEGEGSKHLDTMKDFYSQAVAAGTDRKSVVVALGGGVCGDMAGFLAASYMRGIDFVQVPTSLLAMVDSSVGGKVGVDLAEGKNLVGAFWQPTAVWIDPTVLKTLDDRQLRCGLAEVVKYGMIYDEPLMGWLEENVERLLAYDGEAFTEVIERCCKIKAAVVAQDEREGGLRAILNYGHTFGHALEVAGGYEALLHGEGVSIGMAMAAELAVELGTLSSSERDRQNTLLERFGLPVINSVAEPAKTLELMRSDKKAESGTLKLIVPDGQTGKVAIRADIPEDKIRAAIAACTR